MKKPLVFLSLLVLTLSFLRLADAGEVYLANGDRITGDVVSENEENVVVATPSMGELSIKRSFIHHIVRVPVNPTVFPTQPVPTSNSSAKPSPPKGEQLKPRAWKGEFSPGFDIRRGNTHTTNLNASLRLNKKTTKDEWELKGDSFYTSARKKMTSQRYYGFGRYANNFGEKRKWNYFFKVEADHDRFANIDYRVTPSAGYGYKFSDKPDWRALAELGLGVTHTVFLDDTPDTDEFVLVPRILMEKRIFERLKISQELTMYPSLSETGEYRLRSDTAITNAITDRLSLRFRLIDEYNSFPGEAGIENNDVRIISSLVYSF
jgi:putative salt-induced outer membrane protein YdiY